MSYYTDLTSMSIICWQTCEVFLQTKLLLSHMYFISQLSGSFCAVRYWWRQVPQPFGAQSGNNLQPCKVSKSVLVLKGRWTYFFVIHSVESWHNITCGPVITFSNCLASSCEWVFQTKHIQQHQEITPSAEESQRPLFEWGDTRTDWFSININSPVSREQNVLVRVVVISASMLL